MKIIIILIIGLIHTGCREQSNEKNYVKKQETEVNPNQIFNEIVDLHLNSLNDNIKQKYQIIVSFKPTIESSNLTEIKNRISTSPNEYSKAEQELLQNLINQKSRNVSSSSKMTNQENISDIDIYEIQFSKFILDSTSATSLVATYFRRPNSTLINGGWEEIVIYQKKGDKWTIDKKEMIVEY